MKSFEHMGYWWLPDETIEEIRELPDMAVPGTLSFDPVKGGTLELLGTFENQDRRPSDGVRRYEIIQGQVSDSMAYVTLYNCHVTLANTRVLTFSETRLSVNYIFMGYSHWFNSAKEIEFQKMNVSYTHLNDWISRSSFEYEDVDTDHKRAMDYSITHLTPDPIKIPLEGVALELWEAHASSRTRTRVSMESNYRINILPDTPLCFDEYMRMIRFDLRNFFTLATGHVNFPLEVSGIGVLDQSDEADQSGVTDHSGESSHRRSAPPVYSVYFKLVGYTDTVPTLTAWEMLFTYDDVKETLAKHLSIWMSKSVKLEAICSLCFREHFSRLRVFDSELLSLSQALEAYHRIAVGGEYLPVEEYESISKELIKAIPDTICKAHRSSLESRIKFGNDYSLRTRMKQLINEVLKNQREDVCALVGTTSEFIDKLVRDRNLLTHRQEDVDEFAIPSDERFRFTGKMWILLQICFLREMGFESSEISRLLMRNQEFQLLTDETSRYLRPI